MLLAKVRQLFFSADFHIGCTVNISDWACIMSAPNFLWKLACSCAKEMLEFDSVFSDSV